MVENKTTLARKIISSNSSDGFGPSRVTALSEKYRKSSCMKN